MNKCQETLYFFYEPVSKKFLSTFEGTANIKLVYNTQGKKIKSLAYHNKGVLVKNLERIKK